ncbi:MAG: type I 3-dehydroquinate dehydratase [Chloroflexi bacterium]|mgnify:CR=1 FL=1|nr:type I 3-dehydroquinate dehydratase [Chloroflexota bacterium]
MDSLLLTMPDTANTPLRKTRPFIERPSICVPLVAADFAEARAQVVRLAAKEPDFIEVRLDYLAGLTTETTGELFSALKDLCPVPLLATFRRQEEGGASPLAEPERVAILKAALASGAVQLVDVELRTSEAARQELLEAARRQGVGSVVSYHDFARTPGLPELRDLMAELAATGADILKLAVFPRLPLDSLNLLTVTYEAQANWPDRQLITMAMGGLGGFTRLAGPFYGSVLSFAVGEKSSAPGQPDIDTVRKLWQNWAVSTE